MRKLFRAILLLFVIFAISPTSEAASPKYIFYFIGDGMGSATYKQPNIFAVSGKMPKLPIHSSSLHSPYPPLYRLTLQIIS